MDVFTQIIVSGLTLGAMYAISTVGLSLVYGSLNMLNMAHGGILTIGGYSAYAVSQQLGWPPVFGFLAALVVGAAVGLLIFVATAWPLLSSKNFETNIFIATIGVGAVFENVVLKLFGPYAKPQPLNIAGGIKVGAVLVPYQNISILAVAVVMMILVALLLQRSRTGRAIRATAQNRDAARLMGVHVVRVYAQVLALSGALAAVSGVMISSLATLSPTMGGDPMLKAFIICVVAGLGNTYGAVAAAVVIGLIEASTQYVLGVRFGFALLLLLVIAVLDLAALGHFRQKSGGAALTAGRRDLLVGVAMLAVRERRAVCLSRALSHHPDHGVLHLGNGRHPMESGARRRRDLLAGADGVVCLRLLWHGDARLLLPLAALARDAGFGSAGAGCLDADRARLPATEGPLCRAAHARHRASDLSPDHQ